MIKRHALQFMVTKDADGFIHAFCDCGQWALSAAVGPEVKGRYGMLTPQQVSTGLLRKEYEAHCSESSIHV